MVDTLPDLPGERVRFDLDGSYVNLRRSESSIIDITDEAWKISNLSLDDFINSRDSRFGTGASNLNIVFPEPITLTGTWAWFESGTSQAYYYSLDTTDGLDGTWTKISSGLRLASSVPGTQWRTGLNTFNPGIAGVRGVRLYSYIATKFYACHIYKQPITASSATAGLAFWSATTDSALPLNAFDMGDVIRDTYTDTKAFRIKNLSTTKTATGLAINAEDDSVTLHNAFEVTELSLDEVTWVPAGTPLPLGDITPGNFSPVVYVRAKASLTGTYNPKTASLYTTYTSFA